MRVMEVVYSPNPDEETFSGLVEDLMKMTAANPNLFGSSNPTKTVVLQPAPSSSLWQSISSGVNTGGNLLVNYYNTQQAINSAKAAAEAANYAGPPAAVTQVAAGATSLIGPIAAMAAIGAGLLLLTRKK